MSATDTSAATGALPIPGLSMISQGIQSGVTNLVNIGSGYLDKFFPPEKRKAWKDWLVKFATENPKMASFLLTQLALSGIPLALFIIMTITVVVFALLAGLLIGLIGALLFIVVAVGFALIILLPVLFFTTAAGAFFFLWGLGTYYLVKWFNEKPVPGIHTDAKKGLADASGMSSLPGMDGEPLAEDEGGDSGNNSEKTNGEAPPKGERPAKESGHAKTTGSQHRADGQENGSGDHRVQRKKKAGEGDSAKKQPTGQAHNATKEEGVGH